MKLFRLTIVVIAAILAVMSLILMRATPWLGFILLLMAIVVVITALVAEQPKKHSNQRITREGVDMGTMMYRFDGSKVLLSVKLEEMLAGIGIPDDAISFDQIDGLMAFTECYEQFSGKTLLKRLVLIKLGPGRIVKEINVMLNGVSYQAEIDHESGGSYELYWRDEMAMRLNDSMLAKLYEGFNELDKLDWPVVPDSGPVLFAKTRREESGADEAGNRIVQFRPTTEA